MHTILITIIIICLIVSICLVLVVLHNSHTRKKRSLLLNRFTKFAREHHFNIAVPEILKNCVFGIDPFQQKLLILSRTSGNGHDPTLIDLAKLETCSKKKTWLSSSGGTKKASERHLEKIALWFEFRDGARPAELIFYEYRYDGLYEMPELEQKADHWESLLLKKEFSQRA